MSRTPSRKWELNSNWLTEGKGCGSILSSHLWGGALHDDTKNSCVADYLGALLGILGGGVLSSSPNPDPISEQQKSFSIPISDLACKVHTLFQTNKQGLQTWHTLLQYDYYTEPGPPRQSWPIRLQENNNTFRVVSKFWSRGLSCQGKRPVQGYFILKTPSVKKC